MKITRNFNILPLEYYMTFENGEMSDIFEWEENLTDDEKSAYIETVLLSLPLDESPVLVGVLKRAAKEIWTALYLMSYKFIYSQLRAGCYRPR